MLSRKTFLTGVLGSLVVLTVGCDSERADDDDGAGTTSSTGEDEGDEGDEDDDDDAASGDDEDADPTTDVRSPGPDDEPR